MKWWMFPAALIILAGCGSPQPPLPTQAQLPTRPAATPTTENEANSPPSEAAVDGVQMRFNGIREGAFTNALLSFETGSDYILLLEQPDETNPLQLRVILSGNIEPGTYTVVPADDFALPAGADVAARFDLGFLAEAISGTLVLESIGENSFTGTLDLIAQAEEGALTINGRFQNLNVSVID